MMDESEEKRPVSGSGSGSGSDMDLMKERFAKLLLGEDITGGRKGVTSALALSNAITSLAAYVFGEQKRLEPMHPDMRARWRREIDWLLSVTDNIVELVPSQQKINGVIMEVMKTQQRRDLQLHIPALRKIDMMLLDILDSFKDQKEFSYVSKVSDESEKKRVDDKWWLPTPKVAPGGLSEDARRWLQSHKETVTQVLKAAMAINGQILSKMVIPENYIESLPKNGRASLGESIYKSITDDHFDPEQFLSNMDFSSEQKILDLKNRIEASVMIWKRKMNHKDGKSGWSSGVSLEKRELFEERAETLLLLIKQDYPGISQSTLDKSKIQFNRDVGFAVLESYSRVIESLAYKVLSRIEDVLQADEMAGTSPNTSSQRFSLSKDEIFKLHTTADTSNAATLSDFMGWNMDQAGNIDAKQVDS